MPNAKPNDFAGLNQDGYEALLKTRPGLTGETETERLADAADALSVADEDRHFATPDPTGHHGYAGAAADHVNVSRLRSAASHAAKILRALAGRPDLMDKVEAHIAFETSAKNARPLTTIPASHDQNDLIEKAFHEHFIHLGYGFVQRVMSIGDGGFASMHDSDSKSAFKSRFADEAGKDMLAVILENVGPTAFSERMNLLHPAHDLMPIVDDIPYGAPPYQIEMLARRSAARIIEHVCLVFPEITSRQLSRFADALTRHAKAYIEAEIAFGKTSHDGDTAPWTEERRKLVMTILEDSLTHLPYGIVQDALGVDDGGYASIHDSTTAYPYEGVFANAAGGRIIEALIDEVGEEMVLDFHLDLANVIHSVSIADRNSVDALVELGKDVAEAVVDRICQVFPEAERTRITAFKPAIAKFATEYAASEIQFAESHAPGM